MTRTTIVAILVAGCVGTPALTPHEECAANGLVLDGMTVSNGRGDAVAVEGGRVAVARATAFGTSVSCRRPATPDEDCELVANQVSMNEKLAFGAWWRNALIPVGFVAFIVPGIVMIVGFDAQKRNAGEWAEILYARALADCRARLQRRDGAPGSR